jgi:hypothetical protein
MKKMRGRDSKTMSGEIKIAERLKADLLDELHLMKPADLQAYWQQTKWLKPNLVELSKSEIVVLPRSAGSENKRARTFAPIRYALTKLQPEDVAIASEQLDPFGYLLEALDVGEWSEFCHAHHAPWMTRVWLAAASQLRAEWRVIFKSHGWSDTWEKLRQNPNDLRAAENFLVAQLNHAREQRRNELLAIRVIGLDETSYRRLRRAKRGEGKRRGAAKAEKFIVQHWFELPHGLPGLCFFSDTALETLLKEFALKADEDTATKQLRVRLGLIQAGAKRHLIEEVIGLDGQLRFTSSMVKEDYVLKKGTVITWGGCSLWPH